MFIFPTTTIIWLLLLMGRWGHIQKLVGHRPLHRRGGGCLLVGLFDVAPPNVEVLRRHEIKMGELVRMMMGGSGWGWLGTMVVAMLKEFSRRVGLFHALRDGDRGVSEFNIRVQRSKVEHPLDVVP